MYILVEFTDEKNIAIIPDNWLEGRSCAVWPERLGPGQINRAVYNKIEPEDNWPAYPIRELYRNASFTEVRRKLSKAEEVSDLMTTDLDTEMEDREETSRKSKRKKRAIVYSDEEDEVDVQQRMLKYRKHTRDDYSDEDEHHLQVNKIKIPKPKAPVPPRGNFGQNTSIQKMPTPTASTSDHNQMIARDARLFTCLEKLIRGQEEIKIMIGKFTAALTAMTSSIPSSGREEFTKPDELDLPIQTMEMMQNAEILLEQKEAFNGLVNYLTLIGGRNVADGTRRALSAVMTSEMATKYNWNGLKGKLTFGKLKLCAAVQKAVIKSCKCYASEYEKECREWLRTAADRDGGRKKRRKVLESES